MGRPATAGIGGRLGPAGNQACQDRPRVRRDRLRVLLLLVVLGVGRTVWGDVSRTTTLLPPGAGVPVPTTAPRSPLATFKVGQCVLSAGITSPNQDPRSAWDVETRLAPCRAPLVARVLAVGSMYGVAPTAAAVEAKAGRTVPPKSIGAVVWDATRWIALGPMNPGTIIRP